MLHNTSISLLSYKASSLTCMGSSLQSFVHKPLGGLEHVKAPENLKA